MSKYNFNGWPVTGPARNPRNITKSESSLLVTNSISIAHKLYIGQAGHVSILTKTGSAIYYNMPSGSILPVTDITHVLSSTTTASAFVAQN